MSASGKGLIGLWLYRMGDSTDWTLKEGVPSKMREVSCMVVKGRFAYKDI